MGNLRFYLDESIIGRILEAEPQAVTEIKPVTPHQLWWAIRGCLEKDREKRTPTARRLHTELQDVEEATQQTTITIVENWAKEFEGRE